MNDRLFNNTTFKTRRSQLRKNFTDAERKLWNHLRNKQIEQTKWYRQYSISFYILDFYCPQYHLCIELDGGQHGEVDHEQYDKIRTEFLKKQNVRVLRFWNNEVLQNIEGVVEKIREEIKMPS